MMINRSLYPIRVRAFLRGLLLVMCVSIITACSPKEQDLHESLKTPGRWSYAVDPYGSKADVGRKLIKNNAVRIAFDRAPQPAHDRYSWVELIYRVPNGDLSGVKGVRLTYQCTTELLIKFAQRDYGSDGDKSYGHYQTLLPAAKEWNTAIVTLEDLARPGWTASVGSVDVGLILENVNAIYLTPALNDEEGGSAEINIKAIEFIR